MYCSYFLLCAFYAHVNTHSHVCVNFELIETLYTFERVDSACGFSMKFTRCININIYIYVYISKSWKHVPWNQEHSPGTKAAKDSFFWFIPRNTRLHDVWYDSIGLLVFTLQLYIQLLQNLRNFLFIDLVHIYMYTKKRQFC